MLFDFTKDEALALAKALDWIIESRDNDQEELEYYTELKKSIQNQWYEIKINHDDDGKMLAALLNAEEILVGGFLRPFTDSGYPVMSVLCNDIFAWGYADCEDFKASDIEDIYLAWEKDRKWGTTRWCCIHRNMQPQYPVARDMKRDGSWDEVLEALPENEYDAAIRKNRNPDYGKD